MKYPMLRRRKINAGLYELLHDGEPVAVASLDGTHLDDYPWGWYFTASPPGEEWGTRDVQGSASTLTDCIHSASYRWWAALHPEEAHRG